MFAIIWWILETIYEQIFPEDKSKKEKKNQHLFFFWYKKENFGVIRDKLKSIDREDLIEKLVGDRKKFNKQNIIKDKSKSRRKPGSKFNSKRKHRNKR